MTTDMKRIFIVAAAALLGTCCNRTAETPRTQPPKNVLPRVHCWKTTPIFGRGLARNVRYGSRFHGLYGRQRNLCTRRTQQLACTSRRPDSALHFRQGALPGKGGAIRELHPGDVVKIAPGVIHWHGAAPGSGFTHIAVGTQVSKGPAEWFGPVSDSEYNDTEGHGNR